MFSERVDKYISRGILNGKVHERDLSKFIAKALPLLDDGNGGSDGSSGGNNNTNDVIWAVDIGANVGYHSLHRPNVGQV